MRDPSTVYRGIFSVVSIFLITTGITNIIDAREKGTKTLQAREWIRSLFMIILGVSVMFLTFQTDSTSTNENGENNYE
jgi:uncharacterized membrane protein HdeD (DUF308 family)